MLLNQNEKMVVFNIMKLNILRLLEAKKGLFEQMLELNKAQSATIFDDNLENMFLNIEYKQNIIKEIENIDKKLDKLCFVPESDKDFCEILDSIVKIQKKILEQDEYNRMIAMNRLREYKAELRKTQDEIKRNKGYSGTSSLLGGNFIDINQ